MKALNLTLLSLAVLLQIGDGLTTYLAINKGNVEANKILKTLFDQIGLIPGLILAKGFTVGICVVAYLFAGVYAPYVLGLIVAGYSWVVWNNAKFV
jgi:hypothetical protein